MDLREFGITRGQVEQARDLACRGLLCYQPFIVDEGLHTGVGYQMMSQGNGLVFTDPVPERYAGQPEVAKFLVDPARAPQFIADNRLLDRLYRNMLDFMVDRLGGADGLSFIDVGCCSGYFSVNLARRGAARVVAYDRIDYSETFALLNGLLGTGAEFHNRTYKNGGIAGAEVGDVAVSVAVLVHISDILHHLAFLGRVARKAIFVWTRIIDDPVAGDDKLMIEFKDHNTYYENDPFPYCFDRVHISPRLLRLSLTLMGFTEIHEFTDVPPGVPDRIPELHRGYLAIRP